MAVVFVTKIENGNKKNEGLCIKCAKEIGVPVDNMIGDVMNQFGISQEQLESMEDEIGGFMQNGLLPTEADDLEEGGAPAIDLPKLFGEGGDMPMPFEPKKNSQKGNNGEKPKKYKYLDTYCRNLTKKATDGKLDRI
ncbi:MAG: ATP-dependent Clp protease ATP-binding subunit, partial [Ruminococcaceae bacterium]|nr:ATP-dependent Clp protease ATP-binding subunit [Oscillospiraceae bacterium]